MTPIAWLCALGMVLTWIGLIIAFCSIKSFREEQTRAILYSDLKTEAKLEALWLAFGGDKARDSPRYWKALSDDDSPFNSSEER